jgi:hypothetical protein
MKQSQRRVPTAQSIKIENKKSFFAMILFITPAHNTPRPPSAGFLLFIGYSIHRTPPMPRASNTTRTGHHTRRLPQGQGSKMPQKFLSNPEPTDKSTN